MVTLERVVEVLRTVRPQYMDEAGLQVQLADALEQAGITAGREVKLSAADRIDIWIPGALAAQDQPRHGIGVEVKVKGNYSDVVRQLTRYAIAPETGALILASTSHRHHGLVTHLAGRPVRLVSFVEAGL